MSRSPWHWFGVLVRVAVDSLSQLILTWWNNAGMPLSDYFSAPSDKSAACAAESDVYLGNPPFDVLWMKNLMSIWHLVSVEVFLTGRSEKEVKENPRNGMVLANVEDTVVVVTVSDELTASVRPGRVPRKPRRPRPAGHREGRAPVLPPLHLGETWRVREIVPTRGSLVGMRHLAG